MYSYCTICFQCSVKSAEADRWFRLVDVSETDFISISIIRVPIWLNTQPAWIVYHYHGGACGRSQTDRASGWSLKTAMSSLVLHQMAVLSVWVSLLYGLTWSTEHEAPLTIEIIWLYYFCFLIHPTEYVACCHIQSACIVEFSHIQYPYYVSATTDFSIWLRHRCLICFLNLVLPVPHTPCCTCMGCNTQQRPEGLSSPRVVWVYWWFPSLCYG